LGLIVYLLLIATAVTLYFKDYIEASAIFVVILINALIGFLMELQARQSMEALKEMDVVHSKVIRDGKLQEIPSAKITLGDIIFLDAGDLIPADARVITSNQLQCDESSLSGESFPITKNTKKLKPETILSEQFNMVFKGTSVVNGNGKAVITGISENTELGTIRALVGQSEQLETPLEKKIRQLSKKLIWITLMMTSLFAISGFVKGENWIMILKTSIGGTSYMDREEILKRIAQIKSTVSSKNLPNIYLLHGEFTDQEMNEIYNHLIYQ
jgi:Ca2+-transporting ATPase